MKKSNTIIERNSEDENVKNIISLLELLFDVMLMIFLYFIIISIYMCIY